MSLPLPAPSGALPGALSAGASPGSSTPNGGVNRVLQQVIPKSTLATGVQLAGLALGELSPAGRQYRKDLMSRWRKLQTGQLGMSQAEQEQAAQVANGQINAQQQAAEAQLAQQQAAGDPRAAQQQAALQAAALQAKGFAAGQVAQASAAQAQQAAGNTRQEMLQQYMKNSQTWQQAANAITNPNMYRKRGANGEDISEGVNLFGNKSQMLRDLSGTFGASDASLTGGTGG